MTLFERLRNLKIILIDDDEWIRDAMSCFFEGEGCRLHTAETAEEALRIIKGAGFDIIITDYRLPGMSGLDLIEALKDEIKQKNPVLILVTAFGSADVLSQAKKLGVDSVIQKPFKAEHIEKTLAEFF